MSRTTLWSARGQLGLGGSLRHFLVVWVLFHVLVCQVPRGRIRHESAVRSEASLVGRIAETVGATTPADAAAASSSPDAASAMTVAAAGVRSAASPEASSIMLAGSQAPGARIDGHVGRRLGGYVEHIAEALEAYDAGSAVRHCRGRLAGCSGLAMRVGLLRSPWYSSARQAGVAMRFEFPVGHGMFAYLMAVCSDEWYVAALVVLIP